MHDTLRIICLILASLNCGMFFAEGVFRKTHEHTGHRVAFWQAALWALVTVISAVMVLR